MNFIIDQKALEMHMQYLSSIAKMHSYVFTVSNEPIPGKIISMNNFEQLCAHCPCLSIADTNSHLQYKIICSKGCSFLSSQITDGISAVAYAILGPFIRPENLGEYSCNEISSPILSEKQFTICQTTLDAYTLLISRKHLIRRRSDHFTEISQYVNAHIQDDLSADALQSALLIPRNALYKAVKDETGTSLGHFIQSVRLSHASHLLSSSQYSVNQISELCGIDDLNYFSRIFKRHFGLSPRDYRKNLSL